MLLTDMLNYSRCKMKVNHVMSFLKVLINLCTIKHYIVIEDIFGVIAYSLLVVQKY